jgi:hypothetical protein
VNCLNRKKVFAMLLLPVGAGRSRG